MKFVSFPFRPAFADTVKALKIDSELEDEFRDIYEKCIAVARPKAVFCLVPVHQEGGETVIGTERFKSRIMQVNLQAVRRAPYDASMGAKTYHMSESDRLHSTDDLVGWLTRLITRYAGLVFEQADVKRKDILYDAINYMKQHLGERVTLEDTARQVGFSPNYFSKLSIREICDAVGYEEQSCFIKVFTRFTGVTPVKFRKRGGRLDSSKERDTTAQ